MKPTKSRLYSEHEILSKEVIALKSRIAELEKEREGFDKIRVILTRVKAHNSMMSYEDIDKALTQAIGLLPSPPSKT